MLILWHSKDETSNKKWTCKMAWNYGSLTGEKGSTNPANQITRYNEHYLYSLNNDKSYLTSQQMTQWYKYWAKSYYYYSWHKYKKGKYESRSKILKYNINLQYIHINNYVKKTTLWNLCCSLRSKVNGFLIISISLTFKFLFIYAA
jgi:hypothetical protein